MLLNNQQQQQDMNLLHLSISNKAKCVCILANLLFATD